MPDVKPDENEKDFMERCIPMAIEEGTAEDAEQASAICRAIFEKHMAGESKPAEPSPAEPVKNLDGDVLINFGSAVKALGSGRVGGYLVTYGDPDHTDASGERDYFDKQTDFDFEFPGKSTTYFNHCLPVETKDGRQIIIDRKLTSATPTNLICSKWRLPENSAGRAARRPISSNANELARPIM